MTQRSRRVARASGRQLLQRFPSRSLNTQKLLERGVASDRVERRVLGKYRVAGIAVGGGLLEPSHGLGRLAGERVGARDREGGVMKVPEAVSFFLRPADQARHQ